MTPERLAAIRERLQKATKGPWKQGAETIYGKDHSSVCDIVGFCTEQGQQNGDFIAHAPSDIAALLAECDRLVALIAAPAGDAGEARNG